MQKPLMMMAGAYLLLPIAHAEIIADSIAEFSQTQGQNNWHAGYRNYTADGGGDDYNADTGFISFTESQWDGSGFRLGGNPPWTHCHAESTHPNSAGNGAEHWVIRRWVAADLTEVTPLEVTFAGRKENINCGSGVTVALYRNGIFQYAEPVAGDDSAGVSVVYYLNVLPGDKIDLALTPVGDDNDRGDGCDGSFFSMTINDELPANPEQPDGTPFVPATAADTDGDGIPDFWEENYADGAGLGRFTATGDFDGDGLLDRDEYLRGTDPTKPDTDGDGLSDKVETKTGVWVSAEDTGSDPTKADTDGDGIFDGAEVTGTPATNPNLADTDGDGFSDRDELFYASDPNAADDTPLTHALADSVTQFSGEQGKDGWEYGYRNLNESDLTLNYDPATAFIRFAGGSDNAEEWIGGEDSPQHWRGSVWDLQDNSPWTELTATGGHPNGINGGVTHWAVRRWRATAVTTPTPVTLYWHLGKSNPNDDGVTGYVLVNGRILDAKIIAGNNATGVTRKAFFVVQPNDIVDLVLSPTGLSHSFDYSDGSIQWMRLDRRLPAVPVASTGAFFAAPGAADTDGDGLPDAWELYYTADRTVDPPTPGSLTILTSATADNDGDGLTNAEELARGTHPRFADTDDDGLSDRVETGTGVFVSANDTGTHPCLPDSDEDGVGDFAEANATQFRTNPWLADTDNDGINDRFELRRASHPVIANEFQDVHGGMQPLGALASSILDFSGLQGEASWSAGYRDLFADDGELNYDPALAFIPFTGGDGEGEWDGGDQQWDGGSWRLAGGTAPWTNVGREYNHPNGPNNGAVHWSIRRWTADSLASAKPLGFFWHLSKSNTSCGDGTTAALYLNGERQDEASVAFDDNQGVTHVFYAQVEPGDVIDLVLQHNGNEGGNEDGCDGSNTILRVLEELPDPAIQPDGSIFGAAVTANFVITSVTRAADGAVTLTWPSETGKTYDVYASPTLIAGQWTRLSPAAGLAGNDANLTYTDAALATQPANGTLFYRVEVRP